MVRLLSGLFLLAAFPVAAQLPDTLSWQTLSRVGLGRYEAQGGVIDNRLFVIGGFINGSAQTTARCDVYDPTTDRWTPLRDMPEQITHSGTAVDGDSVIYLAGGFIGNHPGPITDHVWHYDVRRDRWNPFVPLPAARGGGMIICYQRTLHFFGGTIRQGGLFVEDKGDHWALDLNAANPSWQPRAPMPNPRNHLGGGLLDGKLYAVGGQHLHDEDHGNQTAVHAYDPATDTWRTCASLPLPMGHITASVFGWRGHLLVAAGVTEHSTRLNTIFAYDPATDFWHELPPLPAERQSPVIGAWGDVLLANGGLSAQGYVSTEVWRTTLYTPAAAPHQFGDELTVLPNPSSGTSIGLLLDSRDLGTGEIILYDALGRLLHRSTIQKNTLLARVTFQPPAPLAAGVYVVQLRQGNRRAARRFAVTE